jgi:uncharacterized membrane protein
MTFQNNTGSNFRCLGNLKVLQRALLTGRLVAKKYFYSFAPKRILTCKRKQLAVMFVLSYFFLLKYSI